MITVNETRKWINNRSARIALLGIIALGTFLIVFLLFVQLRVEPELLIVWDQQENNCSFWIVNPHKQETISLPGREACRYAIVPIDGRQRLIYVEKYPAVITLFNVSEKELTVNEEIILEGIEITSIPQWSVNNKMYFSAIEAGQEAIYAYTIRTGLVEKLIEYQEGFAYEPVLSPNGKQLVYWVRGDGMTNRYQCFWGECSSGYYYLADLEKQTQMALVSLIEDPQPHTHCHPMWSPSGHFFAFQIGCDTFPSQIVVLDAAANKVLIVIDPLPGTSGVELIGWLSDTELVYRRGAFVQEYNDTFILHQILSTETLSSELLAYLPVRTPEGNIFDLYGAKWAEDGKRVAAIAPGRLIRSLVIVDIRGQIVQQIPFERLRTSWHIAHPIWSDSGQYIAYISAETLDSDVAIVNILDRDGREICSEKLSRVTRLKLGWLTP